ncbi:hypothetical protein BU26DRAFT_500668 [Trematosphaeria pertusa]|uniref:F-box domain-containing protein n=1 Tax=Trematosphaeria pertusa TaxID=390896 RepID=A0A6A6IWU5_9PLEO|nr:uncharacterized protein BU26DRAFT_500668 [Trematosphaeria pertusa]KAF2255025.1 hypothetical protein BU26DRAFT_500668 [Trematosphaeria pertusa]
MPTRSDEGCQPPQETTELPMRQLLPLSIHRMPSPAASGRTSVAPPTLITLPYEMLEAILLLLPLQDLLLCQRVCHCLKEMVASSKPIRRALFLEPSQLSTELSQWEQLKWNPFLETKLSNSLTVRVIGVHRSREGPVKMVAHVRFRKETLTDPDWADILLNEDASWKSMLVTQPPATLLMHPAASLFWKTAMEHQAQFFHDPAGFTLLDLVDCPDW